MTLRSLRSRLTPLLVGTSLFALAGCDTLHDIGHWFGKDDSKHVPGARISLGAKGQDVIAPDPYFKGKAVPVPAPVQVGSWPQPGGTPQNVVGNTDGSSNFGQIWSADIGTSTSSDSAITASPVVGGGMIFTLDAAAKVRAFDASTGGMVWEASLAPEDTSSDFYFFSSAGDAPEEGYGGGLAYDNGRLFVTTGFRAVSALDAKTGGQIWKKQVETPFHTAPTVRDGHVYVMNRDNKAWALDEATGAEVWTHEVFSETASILASNSPAATSEMVVIPYTNGDLYALRTNNGRAIWNDSLTTTDITETASSINDIAGRPAIDGDMVFAVGHAGRLVGINALSGERVWTRDIGGVQTPWVAGDFIYVAALDGNLICLEKRTGKIAWMTYLGRWQDEEGHDDPVEWSGPLMVRGHLVLVSTDGRMAIVAASTGAVEQTVQLSAGSIISPITANGMVYILGDDGKLTAYR